MKCKKMEKKEIFHNPKIIIYFLNKNENRIINRNIFNIYNNNNK